LPSFVQLDSTQMSSTEMSKDSTGRTRFARRDLAELFGWAHNLSGFGLSQRKDWLAISINSAR
jgi:hypothetical protein